MQVDVLRQDLRHAVRAWRRSPGFAVAVVVITALGVGATTAAFTLADHVLLRPLPFHQSDRLVKIVQGSAARPPALRGLGGTNDISPALYLAWKSSSASFSAMGAYGLVSSNLSGSGEPERLDGAVVTADALETIGVAPAVGRPLSRQDDAPGAACSVLISDGLWRRRFGAEPSTLGARVRIDDEPCEIVGVMPPAFSFPARSTTFWRPARFPADAAEIFGNRFLRAIARLKPGTSFEQARDELRGVSAALSPNWPREYADVAPVLIQLRDEINNQSRLLLMAMAGAAICLLLIACTNLASLTVAWATTRNRELAVRMALGAGWPRLVRQLLTESLLLALAGGALGLLLAVAAIPTAVQLVPTVLPIAEIPDLDLRMLAVALLATLGTGIGFGVLPAFRAARGTAAAGLRDSGRIGSSRVTSRVRDALVVVQVAASIVLLVGAGLLLRALMSVQSTPTGFSADRVIAARTFLPFEKYGAQAARVEFYRRVLDGVMALPGVTTAAYTSYLPFTMRGGVWDVNVPGRTPVPGRIENASARFVTPHYFHAMGIPLVSGRPFDESDSIQAQPVAIVSRSFVQSYLESREPLGLTFQFGPAGQRTVVGVVGDIRVRGLEMSSEPQVYLSYQQQGDNRTMGYTPKDLVVRVSGRVSERAALDTLLPAIRRIVHDADPNQPVSEARPLAELVEGETATRAVQARVLGLFAAVSCLLAGVGLHGLLAFVVSSRMREFGVRLAIGAQPRQILQLVVQRGFTLGVTGLAAGLAIAYLAGRSIQSLLAGLSPADLPTLAAATGGSLLMTLAGSLLPALRAARANPRQAMEQ